MDSINLTIDFISAINSESAFTGDLFSNTIIWVCCALVFGSILFVISKKPNLSFIKIFKKSNSIVATTFFGIIISAIVFFAALVSCFLVYSSVFASSNTALEPDTNKITALIQEDGSVNFSSCNLINKSDDLYCLDTVSVSLDDEVKNIGALEDSIIAISGFNGVIYDSNPDGQKHEVVDVDPLSSNSSTELNFMISGLDKDTLLTLIGKRVFNISLLPIKSFNLSYDKGKVDGGIITGEVPEGGFYNEGSVVEVKDQGTLACDNAFFVGWLSDAGDIYQPSDALTIKSDTVLTAQWSKDVYPITLNAGDDVIQSGTTVIYEKYNKGWYSDLFCENIISKIETPSKTGYSFNGYYFNNQAIINSEGNIVVSPDTFNEKKELDATWIINKHQVIFDANGHGTSPEKIDAQEYGTTIQSPGAINPVTGYVHDGKWYKESSCINEWNFQTDTMPDYDLTLYAKWNPVSYAITWDSSGGTKVSGGSANYTIESTGINLPAQEPTKKGYDFAGWLASGTDGDTISGWPDTAFTISPILDNAYGNVTLTAQWLLDKELYYGIETTDDETILYISGEKTSHATILNIDALISTSKESCGWNDKRNSITSVIIESETETLSSAFWFSDLISCESINLEKMNVSNDVNMTDMFSGCDKLKIIYVRTNTDWAQYECSETSNMFLNCNALSGVCGKKKFDYLSNKQIVDNNPLTFACACNETKNGLFTVSSEKKGLDWYSLDELSEAACDISDNGESSIYWYEFNKYIEDDEIWYSGSKGTYNPEDMKVTEEMKPYVCNFTDKGENDINNYLFLRIIGINHDYLSEDNSSRAGLTFQCVNSLPQAYEVGSVLEEGRWPTSSLRLKMQENGEIYNSINNNFIKHMVLADKYCSFSGSEFCAESTDIMFLPSYSETWQQDFGFEDKIRYYLDNGIDFWGEQIFNPLFPLTEGYCYEWNWNHKIKGKNENNILENCYLCNDKSLPYGIDANLNLERSFSPEFNYKHSNINVELGWLGINESGEVNSICPFKKKYSVRPCFCFGDHRQEVYYGVKKGQNTNEVNLYLSASQTQEAPIQDNSILNGFDIENDICPPWYNERESINNVIIQDNTISNLKLKLNSSKQLFYGLNNVSSVQGLNNLDMKNVSDASYMFYELGSNLSEGASAWLSSLSGTNLTNTSYMFANSSIKEIDLSNLNISNVTDMSHMFQGCHLITNHNLYLQNFTNLKETNISFMFGDDQYTNDSIYKIDISGLKEVPNTSNQVKYLFSNLSKLTTIYTSESFNLSKLVPNVDMFNNCVNLKGVETEYQDDQISNVYACIDNGDDNGYFTPKEEHEKGMAVQYAIKHSENVYTDTTLKFVYGYPSDYAPEENPVVGTEYIRVVFDVTYTNYNESLLPSWLYRNPVEGPDSWFITSPVTIIFDNSFLNFKVYNFDDPTIEKRGKTFDSIDLWFDGVIDYGTSLTLPTITGFENINNSIESMERSFSLYRAGQSSGALLDLSEFYQTNLKNIKNAFTNCSFTSLIIPENFAPNITQLSVEAEDGSFTSPFYGFLGNSIILQGDIGSKNAEVVASGLFAGLSVASLDISNMHTSNFVDMSNMFLNNPAITSLNLSSFNTNNTKYMSNMFKDCKSLQHIISTVDWDVNLVMSDEGDKGENMFLGCLFLSGSQGTNIFNATQRGVSDTDIYNAKMCCIDKFETSGNKAGYLWDSNVDFPHAYWGIHDSTLYLSPEYIKDKTETNCEFILVNLHMTMPWEVEALQGKILAVEILQGSDGSKLKPKSCNQWFNNIPFCEKIEGLENIDYNDVISTNKMFGGLGLFSLSCIVDCTKISGTNSLLYCNDMFTGCNVTEINLSNMDTSNVIDMCGMFSQCYVSKIDISSFSSENLISSDSIFNMFSASSNLQEIYVNDSFDLSHLEPFQQMFKGCKNLSGSAGTVYKDDQISNLYARIDKGQTTPGYFRLKE